jgi:AAA15 family ATPase/GTPase
METFKRLKIERWRQFESLDINFETPMTVLTGVNGSGKTTILNILSRHFGWNLNWTSTRGDKKSKFKFWTDIWSLWDESFIPKSDLVDIGELHYSSGSVCLLRVPIKANEQYTINYQDQKPVNGLY